MKKKMNVNTCHAVILKQKLPCCHNSITYNNYNMEKYFETYFNLNHHTNIPNMY